MPPETVGLTGGIHYNFNIIIYLIISLIIYELVCVHCALFNFIITDTSGISPITSCSAIHTCISCISWWYKEQCLVCYPVNQIDTVGIIEASDTSHAITYPVQSDLVEVPSDIGAVRETV